MRRGGRKEEKIAYHLNVEIRLADLGVFFRVLQGLIQHLRPHATRPIWRKDTCR